MWMNVLAMVLAYLLGAIPFGFLIVRLAQGRDIRELGSGNIGATNVLRSGKKWQGVLTLLLDGGKGFLAVKVAGWLLGPDAWTWMTLAAFVAVFGHIFTVFLRFKGGKGVATGCGAYLALTPYAVVTTLVLFALVVLTTRYVSLGSMLATGLFPLWGYLWGEGAGHLVVIWGSIPGALLIISRHRDNIRRLIKGEERKIGQKKSVEPRHPIEGDLNIEHRTSNIEHRSQTANRNPKIHHRGTEDTERTPGSDPQSALRNPQSEINMELRNSGTTDSNSQSAEPRVPNPESRGPMSAKRR
jgi:acyl phosphate:glycerol-3-phosphate acyltransferase